MNARRWYTYVAQNGHRRLTANEVNESLALEQIRVLVTRIDQLGRQRPTRILAVTSSITAEGKTTIATNLAMAMVKFFGKKTLLIDGDFRRPGIAALLGSSFTHGLVEVLKGEVPPTVARWQILENQLTVLPLVKAEPNVASLLSNLAARVRFREAMEGFDSVIIDTPPVLPLADNNLLSDLVDGFLFVIRAEQTPNRLIASAIKNIQRDKLIGLILNNTREFSRAAYGYYYNGPGYCEDLHFDTGHRPQ